jgi:hypothetical protein
MTPKAAVGALRQLPLFEGVSLRLLQDLVEFASQEKWWDDPEVPQGPEGAVGQLGILRSTNRGGTISRRHFEGRWLLAALSSSFSLARSFPGSRRKELFEFLGPVQDEPEQGPPVHWLFLTKDSRFADPERRETDIDLGTASALLARALVRTTTDLKEAVAVATFDRSGVTLERFDDGGRGQTVRIDCARFHRARGPSGGRPSYRLSPLAEECSRLAGSHETAWHVICLAPGDAESIDHDWAAAFGGAFHRIIYLTRPKRRLCPPRRVLMLLRPGAWDPERRDGPYFSSVVPTVVLDDPRERRRRPQLWRDLPTLEVWPFEDMDVSDGRPGPRSLDLRLRRDLCRIRLDFHQPSVCDKQPAIAASLDRWARAVTNRQVGIALSGGGATSAALVPFLEDLQRYNIPFDVVSGLSGGAVLGLYVATSGMRKYWDPLHRLALSVLVPAGMCWSKPIELALNAEFGGAYLEDLETRFIPMTVELRSDGSPRGCAVVGGTLGEAVRVSGIGLGVFAPAQRRGTRYVDGGVALGLPAAILPDFGADMVIGCNSIVPPNGRDLDAILPADVGRYLRWHPLFWLIERWSDAAVGILTTLRDSAREGGEAANVYYEVSAEVTPFLSSFFWCALDRIRQAAAEAHAWEAPLDRCLREWRRLRGQRRA